MKGLLSVIAVGVLSTTTAVPLANQITFNEKKDQLRNFSQQVQPEQIYWRTDHKEYEVKWQYTPNGEYRAWFNSKIHIGKKTISDYKWVSVLDPNQKSYTKTSWGNDAYWGDPFRKIQKFDINKIFKFNKKIFNWDNAWSNATIELLNKEVNAGWAYMRTIHRVGLTYYSENGVNYIQMFGCQLLEVKTSFSGGGMWINLGKGIELS